MRTTYQLQGPGNMMLLYIIFVAGKEDGLF
jgi:hypothetical protein